MILTLPDIRMTEREVKQELALALYAVHKVSLIQGAEIAGVGLFEFQGMLRARHIPQHYGAWELEADFHNFPRKSL